MSEGPLVADALAGAIVSPRAPAWFRAWRRARAFRRFRASALSIGFDLERYTDRDLERGLGRFSLLIKRTTFSAEVTAGALQAFASLGPTAADFQRSARAFARIVQADREVSP